MPSPEQQYLLLIFLLKGPGPQYTQHLLDPILEN